jgi:hypothetical protein
MDGTGTEQFRTIAQTAMDQGRAAGAVSSVQVSHATPASVIACRPGVHMLVASTVLRSSLASVSRRRPLPLSKVRRGASDIAGTP